MLVFITGVNGQLGYDVAKNLLNNTRHSVIGSDLPNINNLNKRVRELSLENKKFNYIQLDITNKNDVKETLSLMVPDIIIHCAAWTNVDKAELKENFNKVRDINVIGTHNIADIANKINAKIVYISTDYVFGDNKKIPHDENSMDFHPLNIYGKSKLDGEFEVLTLCNKAFIIRTSWVFGINGNNFVKSIIKAAYKNPNGILKVVNDQIGLPTYTVDLAKLIIDMIKTDNYGIYHATNSGKYISWYQFAKEICKLTKLKVKIESISTLDYNSPTRRPLNSRLNKNKLIKNGFEDLPDWKDALSRYIKELKDWTIDNL